MKVIKEYDILDEKQRESHEIIDRTLADGAMMVQQTAMSLVNVDTGRLRASITVHRVGNLLYEVFTVVDYAKFQEYGWIYSSGKAFLRPGYERNYQLIIAMLSKEMATL